MKGQTCSPRHSETLAPRFTSSDIHTLIGMGSRSRSTIRAATSPASRMNPPVTKRTSLIPVKLCMVALSTEP